MSEETKLYEIGYHLLPMIAEEALGSEVEKLRSLVEARGGVIVSTELPKSRQLAYTIDKKIANKRSEFNQAYFGTIVFRAPAEAAPEIKAELDKQENILRYMLIDTVPYEAPVRRMPRVDESSEEKPQAVMAETPKEAMKPKLTAEEMDKEVEELIAETV